MRYINTVEYYSAIKRRVFAATWIQLEILIQCEVKSEKDKIPYDITYMWHLKYGTNEPIYKAETDS